MSEKEVGSIIGKAAQLFALASAASLAISVFYNLAYFTFVDIRLVSALTIQDHIASGIAYLPFLLTFQLLMFGLGAFHAWRDEERLSKIQDQDLLDKVRDRIKSQKYKDVEFIVIGTVAIALFTFFMGDMYVPSVYVVPAMAICLYILIQFISKHVHAPSYTAFLLLFSVLIVVFGKAASNAIDDQRPRPASIIIGVEGNTTYASAVRVFPDSVLYFSSGIPTLIKSQNVTRISYAEPLMDLRGRGFCEALNLCLRKQRKVEAISK